MLINTPFFGAQEIDPDTVIRFPAGIPGFEQHHQFKLFHEEGKPTIFWMQSIDDTEVVFSVSLPELFNISYEVNLSDEDCALINLQEPGNATVLVILTRAEGNPNSGDTAQVTSDIRANLNGPLVINVRDKLGMQKITSRLEQYTVLRSID